MSRRRILLGLIGANIMGSLSPALFADAYAAAGIDGFYHLIDVDRLRERRLPQLLDAIKAAGFTGANITYPFKQLYTKSFKDLFFLEIVERRGYKGFGAVNAPIRLNAQSRLVGDSAISGW